MQKEAVVAYLSHHPGNYWDSGKPKNVDHFCMEETGSSFNHSEFCLTTGPQWVLHRVRSSVSSANFQHYDYPVKPTTW